MTSSKVYNNFPVTDTKEMDLELPHQEFEIKKFREIQGNREIIQ